MEACVNHSDHAAIEHCEVCGDALCDLCLWYDDDGRRLCEAHARAYQQEGGQIQSPALYEEGIQVREVDTAALRAPHQGNDNDLAAAAAAVIGAAALAAWFGGVYCLPIVAGILGLVGLSSLKKAVNPERTRNLSLLGIGLSVLSVLPFVIFFCFFSFIMTLAVSSGNFGP